MPVKLRTAKARRPSFAPEVVELFLELEHTPPRRRDGQEFKDKSKRLSNMLGLNTEWWATCHVNDRSRGPCWPPHVAAHSYWYKVRAVREALLAATRTAA